jgi:shikimate kinase
MNVVLIGCRGTGKSAVGSLLAERCHLDFYDTDELIELRGGQSISAMVAMQGWEFFREREKEVVREVSGIDAAVIATGGGVVLDPENISLLKQKGLLIWLVADGDTIVGRILADNNNEQRPSLTEKALADETVAVLAERSPLYRIAADLSVDTSGKSLEDIVDEIFSELSNKEGWSCREIR